MTFAITDVALVTGDGSGPVERTTVAFSESIVAAEPDLSIDPDWQVIDGRGFLLMPGLINTHAHGVTPGPLYPSAAKQLSEDVWTGNLERHLSQGSTTLLNLCGFASPDDVAEANARKRARVVGATCRFPGSLKAAKAVDGSGLEGQDHLDLQEAEAAGFAAYGELGAGHTLGGAGQDYMYIPAALEEATGWRPSTTLSRDLKYAALGRRIDRAETDLSRVRELILGTPIEDKLTPDQVVSIIADCVLPSVADALSAFEEAARRSADTGIPATFHVAAASAEQFLQVAETYSPRGAVLIAAHADHPSFTWRESLRVATRAKELGCLVEVCTLDAFDSRTITESTTTMEKLVEAGLVDLIGTDHAGGAWSSVLSAIEHLHHRQPDALGALVAMATGNPARLIPLLAPGRGVVGPGKVADLTVVKRSNLAEVQAVFVSGILRHGEASWPTSQIIDNPSEEL